MIINSGGSSKNGSMSWLSSRISAANPSSFNADRRNFEREACLRPRREGRGSALRELLGQAVSGFGRSDALLRSAA